MKVVFHANYTWNFESLFKSCKRCLCVYIKKKKKKKLRYTWQIHHASHVQIIYGYITPKIICNSKRYLIHLDLYLILIFFLMSNTKKNIWVYRLSEILKFNYDVNFLKLLTALFRYFKRLYWIKLNKFILFLN